MHKIQLILILIFFCFSGYKNDTTATIYGLYRSLRSITVLAAFKNLEIPAVLTVRTNVYTVYLPL